MNDNNRALNLKATEYPENSELAFSKIVNRFGTKTAYALLESLERLVGIRTEIQAADAAERFRNTLELLRQKSDTLH